MIYVAFNNFGDNWVSGRQIAPLLSALKQIEFQQNIIRVDYVNPSFIIDLTYTCTGNIQHVLFSYNFTMYPIESIVKTPWSPLSNIHPIFETVYISQKRNSTPHFVMLPEWRNKNYSFPQVGIEPTFGLRIYSQRLYRCATTRQPQ